MIQRLISSIKVGTLLFSLSLLLYTTFVQSGSIEIQANLNQEQIIEPDKIILELENKYKLDKESKRLKQLLLGEWNIVKTINGEKYKQLYRFQDTDTLEVYENRKQPAYILEWDITPSAQNDCCYNAPFPEFLFWFRVAHYHEDQRNNVHEWWALPIRKITHTSFRIDSLDGKRIE